MNEHVKALPNRRWDPKRKVWHAPLIRLNVERVQALLTRGLAQASAAASEAIAQYWAERASAEKARQRSLWPSWYRGKGEDPLKHQELACRKLYGRKAAALFSVMGTGKTKVAVDIATALRMEGLISAVLVECKLSVRRNWARELDKRCPLPFDVFLPETHKPKQVEAWLGKQHDFKWMVVGTESMSSGGMFDIAHRFLLTGTSIFMILDESDMISSPTAERTKKTITLGRSAEYRLAMTGTPMTEGPLNVYSQFEFLDPDIIGTGDYYAFRNRYAVMGGYENKQVIGYDHLEELAQIIAPHIFEVGKEVLNLPPKRYTTRTVEMSPEQAALYKALKKHGGAIEGMTPKNVLEQMLRLHEIAQGYRSRRVETLDLEGDIDESIERTPIHARWQDNPKIRELIDIVKDARAQSTGAIVWCAYRAELATIAAALAESGFTSTQYHGGLDEAERDASVERFQGGDAHVFLGTITAGGVGITLTRADTVIYYSNRFSLRDRLQSEDRAHRIGQTKSVLYVDLVADRTIDLLCLAALEKKFDLVSYVRKLITEKANAELDTVFEQ